MSKPSQAAAKIAATGSVLCALLLGLSLSSADTEAGTEAGTETGPGASADNTDVHRVQLPSTTPLSGVADRLWWGPRVPSLSPFPGTTGNRAQDCGMCHTEIYGEWRTSTHAAAWTDRQFQKELHKDPEVAWICVNCHVPAADQQDTVISWDVDRGIRDVDRSANPNVDPSWQAEGISCLTCHWSALGIKAPHKDTVAPHPTVYAPELQEAQLCLSCHQADVRLEDALVCHFTTGQEWTEAGQIKPCQQCHMPEVTRASALGAPVRQTRHHAWPGSLIPKSDPPPQGFTAATASWQAGIEATIELPAAALAGQQIDAVVHLSNVRAGHRVPTGDPERYLLIQTQVTANLPSTAGPVIAGAQARIGQRWIWWPLARQLDDNRLRPGETRTWTVPFIQPAAGATVQVRVQHFRISPENAAWHGLDNYPTSRQVQRIAVSVPTAPGVIDATATDAIP